MMAATGTPSTSGASKLRRLLGGALGPLLALLVIVLLFAAADHLLAFFGDTGAHFASVRNLRIVLVSTAKVAVAALGMLLVIIAGGIDLSAGTMLTLCATMMAFGVKADWPVALALLATLGVGSLCGLVNGLLISTLRVVPFIVTLGTMTIFLGIGKKLSGESTIFPGREQIPDWLQNFCSTKDPDVYYGFLPNIPLGIWAALVLALIVAAVLRYTVFGRHVFALGSNEATARLCGVNIPLTKLAVYTLGGLFVAMAGIYQFSILKMGNPMEGKGMELPVIAAVVIGGGSLSGGRGSVIGTLTGAAIMEVIKSGCDQLGVSSPYQDITIGVVIVAAVTLDQIRQRRLAG